MQTEQLLHIIKHPQDINAEQAKSLRKLLYQYPYFQLACTLIAKAAYDQDPTQAQQAIQLAAVYATDRNHLKLLLENKLAIYAGTNKNLPQAAANNNTPIPPKIPHQQEKVAETDFINSYITTLQNKAVKKVTKLKSLEQLNIIENFIQQGGQFSAITIQDMALEDSQVDLTEASNTLHDDLITESLAQVMIKQGKFKRALEIYKKLQLKFPEKKSYFSVLHDALKKEI